MSQRSPGGDEQPPSTVLKATTLLPTPESHLTPHDEKPKLEDEEDEQWEDDAPPKYESVFGHFKETKEKPNKTAKLAGKLFHVFAGTVSTALLLVVVLALPVAMIVIGVKYKGRCPIEPFIPIYLIVGGSFGIVKTLFVLCQRATVGDLASMEPGDEHQPIMSRLVDNVLNMFLFVWFVAGNVWVYSNYRPHPLPPPHQPRNYCDPTLYWFAFWVITTSYILMGVILFCICCLGFCASCTAYFITNAA